MKRVAFCEELGHFPEYVIGSMPAPDGSLDRLDVIQDPEGKSTNQWADGAFGVPDDVRDLCDCDEEPLCGTCHDDGLYHLCSWRDVPDDHEPTPTY